MLEPKGSLLASRAYHCSRDRAGCAAWCAAYCLCFFTGFLASAAVANAASRTASPNPATTNRIANLHCPDTPRGLAPTAPQTAHAVKGVDVSPRAARPSVSSGGPAVLGRRWRRLAGLADGDKVTSIITPPAGRRRWHDAQDRRQQALPTLAIVPARRLPEAQLLGEQILRRAALA